MKRNSKNVELKEVNLSAEDTRVMLFKIIDQQIMNVKMQFQSDWESDHRISPDTLDNKLTELQNQKQALLNAINSYKVDGVRLDFNLSIDVREHASEKSGSKKERLAS